MSDSKISKILRVALWGLLGLSLVFFIIFLWQNGSAEGRPAQLDACNWIIVWTYILAAIAAVLAVVFPLLHIIMNPKGAGKFFISLGAVVVVVLIGYLLGSGEAIHTATSASNPNFSDSSVLRWTDTGIISTYILMGVAVLTLIAGGLKSLIRR